MEQELRVEQKIEREMLRDNLGERNQNTTQFRHDCFFFSSSSSNSSSEKLRLLEEVDGWGTKYSQLWGFPHRAPSLCW